MRVSVILIGLGLTLGFATSVWAKTPKCYSDKLKAAGKYSFCRLKAQSRIHPLAGQAVDYSKCERTFSAKWQRTERSGACVTPGDEAAIRDQVATDADTIRARLSGLGERYVYNGDGTVTDFQTGLMWERKVLGAGCLHCMDDTYNWTDAMSEWLSRVNGSTDDPDAQAGLGGHSDWRLPTIVELQTIRDCGFGPPCIDPIFWRTTPSFYWSSSTFAINQPGNVWFVNFDDGGVGVSSDSSGNFVRAVRTFGYFAVASDPDG